MNADIAIGPDLSEAFRNTAGFQYNVFRHVILPWSNCNHCLVFSQNGKQLSCFTGYGDLRNRIRSDSHLRVLQESLFKIAG
jgi:hypothetical protein